MNKLIFLGFKINFKAILGWCVAVFGIMFLYMILFPSIQDMANIKLDAMPKELLQFVGLENMSDMNNFVSYFGMIFKLILIAISIFSVTFSSGIISKEEKNKTIEFLYSQKFSRIEIFMSKCFVSYVAVLAVIACATISTLICGFAVGGETFIVEDITSMVGISLITPFFFFIVGSAIAGFSGKIASNMIGSLVVLVSYLIGYLGTLLGEETLSYFSPFEIFTPTNALNIENDMVVAMIIYFVLSVLLILGSALVYKKRDFSI